MARFDEKLGIILSLDEKEALDNVVEFPDEFKDIAGVKDLNDWCGKKRNEFDEYWETKREEVIENEVDEILIEKQGDLEDLARDNFLDK